jgi:hypothetical protein
VTRDRESGCPGGRHPAWLRAGHAIAAAARQAACLGLHGRAGPALGPDGTTRVGGGVGGSIFRMKTLCFCVCMCTMMRESIFMYAARTLVSVCDLRVLAPGDRAWLFSHVP